MTEDTKKSGAGLVAKFDSIGGGVWIEETSAHKRRVSDRCFRFDEDGRAEYAFFGDLKANGECARWYGHQFTVKDFVLC